MNQQVGARTESPERPSRTGPDAVAPTGEALFQRIVEESQDAIVFADREGIIRIWNAGAEAMFGYRADEAVGQSLDLIVPERFRKRHWDGYHTVMATGETKYGRELLAVPGATRGGDRISLEFSISLLKGPTGEPLGAAAVLRDVTERWQKEKELRERLATLEAQVRVENRA
jgi:PAS domain S-box-containing protein